jgi:pimeloyl-ACP methyl ester carboxylesterase
MSADVVLLHGFAASADANWHRPGITAAIEPAGLVVHAPDLLGHGSAPKPHDSDAYARDALARRVLDGAPSRFALVGYSLGAGVAARVALLAPDRVERLALCGMGDSYMDPHWPRPEKVAAALRAGNTDDRDAASFLAFVDRSGGDRLALAAVQDHVPRCSPAELATLTMPTMVLCGADDRVNGDPAVLAAAIPGAELTACSGDHLSAVGQADFAAALVAFLMA